jgi:pimeloyl-ACP methyl ester carboxylesterase
MRDACMIDWCYSFTLSLAKPETRRMMLKLYRSVNPKDFVEREDRLHNLTAQVPTLVLWGDKDPFITPEYAEQFGSAHVEHFPQNGHWLAARPYPLPQALPSEYGFASSS